MTSASPPAPASHDRRSGLAEPLRLSVYLLVLLTFMALMPIGPLLPQVFLFRQDLPVIVLLFALLGAMRTWQLPITGRRYDGNVARPVLLLGAALLVVCVAGHHIVMWGYALSRDEQLVLFDAEVFAHGSLAAHLPAEWGPLHQALNVLYMPVGFQGEGWVSIYRPVNAAFHALVGLAGDRAWTNPILAVIGLVATWRVARRLLPDDRESQFVAVLLYATSTQVLALAMTSYAMTGHLALNMVWLALFLRDKWYAHIGAIVVGLLAIGLHQLIYHPLFAGPFLFFSLVLKRRWGWSAVYAFAYAAGILLWARYSIYPLRELGMKPAPSDGDGFLLTRMLWAVQELSPEYLWIKAVNLVRFIAWQNLILLPLLLVGMRSAVKSRDRRLWGMVAAIAALIVFKLVLRPYQGHGWGYRYMHGVVGIACILAAIGWGELRARGAIGMRHLQIATAATMLAAAPWLLWQAHQFSGIFARQDRAIARTDADLVIVENGGAEFAQDLVYNPPYLDRRPIRLLASELDGADLARLCAGRSVAFVDAKTLASFNAVVGRASDPRANRIPELRRAALAVGCDVRAYAAPD